MNSVLRITAEEFLPFIEGSQGAACVLFGADWCKPCTIVKTLLEGLPELPRMPVRYLEASVAGEWIQGEGIRGFPTLVFYSEGEEIHRVSGALSLAELLSLLHEHKIIPL